VTVEFVECLASCGTGPVVMVDEELYEKVDVARAREIVAPDQGGGGRERRNLEPSNCETCCDQLKFRCGSALRMKNS